MAQSGRGGSPSGFISSSRLGDLHKTSTDDEHLPNQTGYSNGNGNGNGNGHTTGLTSPRVQIDAEDSLITVRDLRKSGLTPDDLRARVLGAPEKAACRIPSRGEGYVIPYFDINGQPLTYYRSRILNPDHSTNGVKYKAPAKTPNHVYFPPRFKHRAERIIRDEKRRFIILTEGEKKATCAMKLGFPAVAFAGVDSWRSRTIILPEDTEFYQQKYEEAPRPSNKARAGGDAGSGRQGPVSARLPSSDISVPELISLAKGFGDLIDFIVQHHLRPVIIYDSDFGGTLKAEVQRAATMLGYELVYLGIHALDVKQVILPSLKDQPETENQDDQDGEVEGEDAKTGLDDYLMDKGPEALERLISRALNDPTAFPRHPNPKGFISSQLQNKLSRKASQQVASIILTELDASGLRMQDRITQMPYYFDRNTCILTPAKLLDSRGAPYHEAKFGQLLYRKYGISAADSRVLVWLASQFTGEEPILTVSPKKVCTLITEAQDALNPYGIAVQASDSQFFAVSPDPTKPVEVLTNGSKGILFVQDQVEPLDVEQVLEFFDHFLDEAKELGYLEPWWQEVIKTSTLGVTIEFDDEPNAEGIIDPNGRITLTDQGQLQRHYACLLAYISPFLLRWRDLQLPIELTVGPPGSGKSSMYSLRLEILTGRPKLRNIPTDIKDFQASLAHTGGLHVTDNVNFVNRELRQRMSDELCRITTEPSPEIEQRKYYTNDEVHRIEVSCAFAFTALQMPFNNEDLIQRSVTFNTQFIERDPEGDWVKRQLNERGGREAWIAHHLVFLHLFLKETWAPDFKTSHRLAHLEQALTIASKVLRIEMQQTPTPESLSGQVAGSVQQVVTKSVGLGKGLTQNQSGQMEENDSVLQLVKAFVTANYSQLSQPGASSDRFDAKQLTEFAQGEESFMETDYLTNTRKLGRYLTERHQALWRVLNVKAVGTYANRMTYRYFVPEKAGADGPT